MQSDAIRGAYGGTARWDEQDAPKIVAFLTYLNPLLIDAITGANNDTLTSHRLKGRHEFDAVQMRVMSHRIIRLCKDVERLACELDRLTSRGHSRTVYAVLMRMRLAAMTAELVTADLVERLQQAPAAANAASEDSRAPR